MDDFGTGYSSLSYLKRFPIDRVKIDRSFICDAVDGHEDAAIAIAIIVMAKSPGLEVTAEGVETQEQYNFLRDHGCHEIQGYFIARPMPAIRLKISPGQASKGAIRFRSIYIVCKSMCKSIMYWGSVLSIECHIVIR